MNTLSPQEAFDRAVAATIAQAKPSVDFFGYPAYHGRNSCRCPVGALIPDHAYDSTLERRRAYSELVRQALGNPSHETLGVLSGLQHAHDSNVAHPNFLERFKIVALGVARSFNLNTEVLSHA